jgi:hypothetical protein
MMPNSTDIDQIVQEILADMPLKEKAAIVNLDEVIINLFRPYVSVFWKTCM